MRPGTLLIVACLGLAGEVGACDLCAIYNASNARGESGSGFLFTVSEQFIPFRTVQADGHEVHPANPDFLDSAITHLVPGYNLSPRLGVSLNLPLSYRNFQRTDLRYSLTAPPVFQTERGHEFDPGDVALIGRWTIFQKSKMKRGLIVTLLGGVKFPTGGTDRLKDEVEQSRIFEALLPPSTPHDPLGHSVSSVHQHDLSPGSGSFDGITGLTVNGRWQRWFCNAQFQYYIRTEGESSFRYGDELIISGGPGAYVLLFENSTLSLQANAVYDTMARDRLLGRASDRTGETAWYFGPQLNFTLGGHLSANAGVDLPLRIGNNGFRNVPDYRLYAGATWRF